ncbi:MAG: protein kinase [Gemmatimonadaceae bacterium]|nr:protein kinase [Gemmatimonadaceae bacterium]
MSTPLERLKDAFAGQYEITSEVGSGGMATVYLARDLKHDRQVAIKVLRPELAAALGPDRFPREIRIVAQLSHPHVLPLHDSGEVAGFLYYVMPYVDGESLRAKVEREGQLPVHDAVRILREVADALAYAHEHGVMHRDIKPDNVMLSGRHALVMDFGVAKAVSKAAGDKLTTVGVAVGTPTYMSPEQATGEEHIDHRSDIYSLGVLGYELLAGEPPFQGKSAQVILSAHVLEKPKSVSEIRKAVSPVLADLIARCMEKNPADRPQTAEEVLLELEALATPSGGVTPTTTRPMRATKAKAPAAGTRMRNALVGVAIALALVLGGFGAWATLGNAAPGPERLAVLPLTDVSGQDGEVVTVLVNQLGVALGQVSGVTVAPPSAVNPYKTAPKPLDEMARDLNVGAFLEGNVFRSGQRLRVTLQLTNPHSIGQFWAGSYDIDLTADVLEAVDKVIPDIVNGIRTRLQTPTT